MRSIQTANGEMAPAKWTGVVEDAAKQPTQAQADREMGLVQDLVPTQDGQSNVYVKESLWVSPGQVGPDTTDFANLENSIRAAQADNKNICLAVWPFTWGEGKDHYMPPLSPGRQRAYATFLSTVAHMLRRDFNDTDPVNCWFIGDEPNNGTFWWPQYTPQGTDAAAPSYERLLARSYDTLKAISPDFLVIGGELASHGNNDPKAKHRSHSPEAFIRDMGAAYRASGRTRPIMDIFGFHPYGLNSSESPATPHPNDPNMIGEADYSRLVSDLGDAFDGTAQPGSKLPILYSEYGDESIIPGPQRYRYHNQEPASSGAVYESVQQTNYATYFGLAACQPNVIGALMFHTADESNLKGWQSGAFYSDGAKKSSEPAISQDMQALSEGTDLCRK